MSLDNVYSFTVQRQNSSEVPLGKSPCVKIKFIKDESIKNSPKIKLGQDNISELTSVSDDEKPELTADDASGSSPLSICPIFNRETNCPQSMKSLFIEMHKMIEKKDNHFIFAYPVTEEQAPNYRSIIEQPIDLQTIRHKIDNGLYQSVAGLADDLILMCQNALIYNTSDTVYYKIASQMLNYIKKIFPRETINKFVMTKLYWTRGLTDEEMGDLVECLNRVKSIQADITKNSSSGRPQRAIQKNIQQDTTNKKRKNQISVQGSLQKKSHIQTFLENIVQSEISESEIDDVSIINLSDDNDDVIDEEEEDNSDTLNDILTSAQNVAALAKKNLEKYQQRPVVHLEQDGEIISLVNCQSGEKYTIENEFQSMINRIGSVNVEQMIGENDRVLSQLGQLCYDPNEFVALTTSKPLDAYSCAEQAVLVETFGDVVTAEYACNLHNFVLDLPTSNPALELVKNKLNVATNYLTYGVDQIIIKKLKAAAEASRL